MKKYSNIPIRERKQNADKMYRHEENLEERAFKRLIKDKERQKQNMTNKDRECNEAENETYKRLKAIEKGVL